MVRNYERRKLKNQGRVQACRPVTGPAHLGPGHVSVDSCSDHRQASGRRLFSLCAFQARHLSLPAFPAPVCPKLCRLCDPRNPIAWLTSPFDPPSPCLTGSPRSPRMSGTVPRSTTRTLSKRVNCMVHFPPPSILPSIHPLASPALPFRACQGRRCTRGRARCPAHIHRRHPSRQ